MAIEQKQVSYAKEVDDVLALLVKLVSDIKAKKSIVQIGAEDLPLILAAVDGAASIPAEIAADQSVVFQTAGSRMGELLAVLIKPAPVPPPAA